MYIIVSLWIIIIMTARIILSLCVGILLWYFFFYIRYESRDLINDLRKNLKIANKDLLKIRLDHEEFEQQNTILREQVSDLFKKNDDLVRVVSELSRYYYHIKVWSEKVKELADFLQVPDESMAKKIQKYLPDEQDDGDDDDDDQILRNNPKESTKEIAKREFF